MTDPCDEDWETLNAYLDGELPGGEHRAFARRLARDPDLAIAAAELRAQSESLARMRPVAGVGSPVWGRPAVWGGAVAATLAVALFFAFPGGGRTDLASIHQTFLEQSFPTSNDAHAEVSLNVGRSLPDLSPAGLALVAVREVKGGVAGHYAGRNACRLTLLRLEAGSAHGPAAPNIWIAGERRYTILAEGMKPDRLAAIEAYLRAVTGPDGTGVTRMALSQQVSATETCA